MYKKILIITNSFDLTSDCLTSTDKHVQFVRVNADKFSDYSFLVSEDGVKIKTLNGEFFIQEFFSTYYRKHSLPKLNDIMAGESQAITQKEIFSPLESVAETFYGNSLSLSSTVKKANNNRAQSLKTTPIRFNQPPNRSINSEEWAQSTDDIANSVKPVSVGAKKPETTLPKKDTTLKTFAIKFLLAVVLALIASLPVTLVVLLRFANMEPKEFTVLSLLNNYKYLYILLTSISFFVVFRVFSSFKK
jgi:hypothetical protein